jgi:hypothetical protein
LKLARKILKQNNLKSNSKAKTNPNISNCFILIKRLKKQAERWTKMGKRTAI